MWGKSVRADGIFGVRTGGLWEWDSVAYLLCAQVMGRARTLIHVITALAGA